MNKKQKNSGKPTIYDVFLSYNANEKNAVEQIATWLKSNKIKVWFDKWELRPGLPWQDALENAIIESKCTAVFLGSSGLGPWEIPEMRASLMEHVERGRPVIPVLLPGCNDAPELPIFLKGHTWVDFRRGIYNQESQRNLLWGITGEKPNFVQESVQTELKIEKHKLKDTKSTVFIFNKLGGSFNDIFNAVIKPILESHSLSFETLSDVYSDKTKNLAIALEEKAFDADILLFNLDQETPWIPLSLQAPTGPPKKVIILLERDIELPDALSFDHVIRYSTNPAGLKKLYSSFESIFKVILNPDKITEAENLYKLKFYDAAIVSTANHLYEFLRNRALSVFGAKHFQSRPLRFHSMKELFILLMRKKRLKIKYKGKLIEWEKIIAVRNQAAHGNISNSDSELCLWYLNEVRKLLELNKNDQAK